MPPRRPAPFPQPRITPGRLARIGTWALLGFALLIFALMVVGPRTGAYRVSVVLSDSMAPNWERGDLVIVTPQRASDVRVGQVITYNPPIEGRPSVTHRVVAVQDEGSDPVIVTKGDANAAPDEWGPVRLTSDTVWRVRSSVPKAGHLLAGLQGRFTALVTTVLAPMALLVLLLVHIWRPRPQANPT